MRGDQQNSHWEENHGWYREPLVQNWIASPATTYGGTVRRLETAAEYPNPWMIEGKKNAIP